MLSQCTFLLYVTTYQSLQHSWWMNSLSSWKLLPHPGIPLPPGDGSRFSHRAVHAAAAQCLHEHTEFCSQTLLQQRLNHWFMLQTTMQISGSPTSTKQVSVYQGRAGHTSQTAGELDQASCILPRVLPPNTILFNQPTFSLNLCLINTAIFSLFLFWWISITWLEKKNNVPLKMLPPFTPSSSERMFHGSTQLESAGLCTTKASCLEPKRLHFSNQMYNHFENKKIRLPLIPLSFCLMA